MDADSVTYRNVSVISAASPAVDVLNGQNIVFDHVGVPEGADPFLSVQDSCSRNIRVVNSPVRNAKKALAIGAGVSSQTVIIQ